MVDVDNERYFDKSFIVIFLFSFIRLGLIGYSRNKGENRNQTNNVLKLMISILSLYLKFFPTRLRVILRLKIHIW